ncbi:MAG: sialidase family protein [Dehalococcoidia bacterium]
MVVAAATVRSAGPVEPLSTPAGPGSGMYSLATGGDGRVYLSWLEPAGDKTHALRFARLDGGAWSAPSEIARAGDWFVNWADHPSVTAGADGTLFAHWLVTTGRSASYGYAIRAATSPDAGRTWRTAFEEGTRNVADYSGFLTFLPRSGGVDAVYLTPLSPDDGSGAAHDHIKTVGIARFDASGALTSRQIVDGDACSCCSTDMAETVAGPVAVYRDHDAGDIRDISIVRFVDGKWTVPAPVHRDGWHIAGCPTNGPAVAASGARVAVAWFTAAGGTPMVKVAFSGDAGASFAAPLRLDGGNPVGWADVLLLDDGRAVVSWLERTGDGVGEIRLRVAGDGGLAAPITVATAASGRGTGIPMIARAGDAAIVAWRDGQVRTARVALSAMGTASR